jgi:hypothetical protein
VGNLSACFDEKGTDFWIPESPVWSATTEKLQHVLWLSEYMRTGVMVGGTPRHVKKRMPSSPLDRHSLGVHIMIHACAAIHCG